MRKDRYSKAFAQHLPYLRQIVRATGLTNDEANDVISKCAEDLFKKKIYSTVEPHKLRAFLRTHVRFEAQHYKTSETARRSLVARLPDSEWSDEQSTVTVSQTVDLGSIEETECPFCFKANLNEYGACHMCHTIIPSHIRVFRKGTSITVESLSVDFDFNKMIDVHKAVARLTPLEQRVVKACGLGNESLESFALDSEMSKAWMVGVWVRAKEKLQGYLSEYAPDGHVKSKSVEQIRQAFLKMPVQNVENRENT